MSMGKLTILILFWFPHLSQEAHIFLLVCVVRKEISNILEVLLNSSVEGKIARYQQEALALER